ncbi:MAG: hypothetical protein PWR16_1384 [Methanoculleus sp.]|nr:hypothetical protein [Methanoculleus sp.]
MAAKRPTMQGRAYFDSLLTRYIEEQPDDTGQFTLSQVRIGLGTSIDSRSFSAHLERAAATTRRGCRPFTIARVTRGARVKAGGYAHAVYQYKRESQ